MKDLTLFSAAEDQQKFLLKIKADFIDKVPLDLEVSSEKDARQALSYALQSRKLKKQVEETRKEIVRPHIDFQKAIMKFSKDFSDNLEKIEAQLQLKIEGWMKCQKENPFTFVNALEVEDGKIYLKTHFDFEVEDVNLVPRKFLVLDKALVEAAIEQGTRCIPGIKITKNEFTQLKVKN